MAASGLSQSVFPTINDAAAGVKQDRRTAVKGFVAFIGYGFTKTISRYSGGGLVVAAGPVSAAGKKRRRSGRRLKPV